MGMFNGSKTCGLPSLVVTLTVPGNQVPSTSCSYIHGSWPLTSDINLFCNFIESQTDWEDLQA